MLITEMVQKNVAGKFSLHKPTIAINPAVEVSIIILLGALPDSTMDIRCPVKQLIKINQRVCNSPPQNLLTVAMISFSRKTPSPSPVPDACGENGSTA